MSKLVGTDQANRLDQYELRRIFLNLDLHRLVKEEDQSLSSEGSPYALEFELLRALYLPVCPH